MKIHTLRDYTRLSEPVTAAASILTGLLGLFGGNKGEWVNGRFIPGDIDNRLNFLAQRLAQYGLTELDIDKARVDAFIYSPSGWQGNIDNYVISVYQDKQANPDKYNNRTYSPTAFNPSQMNTGNLFGGMNVQTVLLVGAGLFLAMNYLSKNRKR
jgi:hypothetical protein